MLLLQNSKQECLLHRPKGFRSFPNQWSAKSLISWSHFPTTSFNYFLVYFADALTSASITWLEATTERASGVAGPDKNPIAMDWIRRTIMLWKKLRRCFSVITMDRLRKATMEGLLSTRERLFTWSACGCEDLGRQSGMSVMITCEFAWSRPELSNNLIHDQRNEGIHRRMEHRWRPWFNFGIPIKYLQRWRPRLRRLFVYDTS